LSVAVGAVQFTVAWQDASAFTTIGEAGHPLIAGAEVSTMVTLNEQVDVFPKSSVAVYCTVVTPLGKLLPEVCVLVNVTLPQLSVAVGGVQVTGVEQVAFADLTILPGQPVITGFVLSRSAGWQHNGPPFLLWAAINVKLP